MNDPHAVYAPPTHDDHRRWPGCVFVALAVVAILGCVALGLWIGG